MPALGIVALLVLILYGILGYKRPGIAMATVFPAAAALGCASVYSEQEEFLLFVPLLIVVTTVIAVSVWVSRGIEVGPGRWVRWLLVGLATIVLLPVIASVVFIFGPSGTILLTLTMASIISYVVSSRWSTVTHVLSTLGACMRQNLPLPMGLECATAGATNRNARILRQIQKWLVQGYSVVESIRRGYPGCPPRILAMLSAGENIGQLPAAIETARTDVRSQRSEYKRLRPVDHFFTILYPIMIMGIVFMMLLALMTFVMPTFKAVLEEMCEGQLPELTQRVLAVSGYLVYGNGAIWITLVFLLLVWVAIPLWLRGRFRHRRPDQPFILSRLADFVKWHLPGLHWFERNYSTLQVVELLRMSLGTGCPVNKAIAASLDLDVNACFRRRLKCWLDRVERGDDIAASASRCGLGTPLAWAFDQSVGVTDAPTVLGMLESFYRSNYSYRVNLARFVLWPCIIIALGLVVGTVVLSVFLPLISVITHLAEYIYP